MNSLTFNSNYFLPGTLGGDHAFKFGGYWRDSFNFSASQRGGYATVRFPTSIDNSCATAGDGCQVDVVRNGYSWCTT